MIGCKIGMMSGKVLDFSDPLPEEICITDIAHNLSMICRFNGACPKHYSVAEHSLILADAMVGEFKVAAFLHDAHEAYTGDIISPVKSILGIRFDNLVWSLDRAIALKLLSDSEADLFTSPQVQAMDAYILDAEIRTFFPGKQYKSTTYIADESMVKILQSKIQFLSATEAKTKFLKKARELGIREG